MQAIFTKGEKKLLKGLKIKYFQFIIMSVRSLEKKKKKMKKIKKMKKMKKKTRPKTKKQEEQKGESKESKFLKYIENESKDISYILLSYYFNFEKPSDLAKKLFEIKDKKNNNDFVKEIQNRWSNLNDRTKKENWRIKNIRSC